MVDELAARGVTRVYLEVEQGNTNAITLYKRSGFRSIGALPNYYGPGIDGLHMMCNVSTAPTLFDELMIARRGDACVALTIQPCPLLRTHRTPNNHWSRCPSRSPFSASSLVPVFLALLISARSTTPATPRAAHRAHQHLRWAALPVLLRPPRRHRQNSTAIFARRWNQPAASALFSTPPPMIRRCLQIRAERDRARG